MNHLYLSRRKKNKTIGHSVIEEAKESGSIVGYWLLPTSSGYVKLKILDTYQVQTNRGGFFGSKLGSGRTIAVKTFSNGSYLPVWPVLNAMGTLKKFFKLPGIDQSTNSPIWSPDDEARGQAAASLQASLIKQGLCFVIRAGDTVHWCGNNQGLLKLFMTELAGMKTFNPVSLSILTGKYDPQDLTYAQTDTRSEVTKLSLLNPSGEKLKTLTMNSVFGSLFKSTASFSQYINGVDSPTIANFYRGGTKWKSPEDWKGIESDQIRSAVDLQVITKEYESASDKTWFLNTLKILLAYAKRVGVRTQWKPEEIKSLVEKQPELAAVLVGKEKTRDKRVSRPIYKPPVKESLSEASFRDLLNDTLRNGGYKIGGLRRVGRIWVYDRSVPGRVANSRFVVTRRPKLQLDKDGYPIYNFQFRSRPDRNTTNMAHAGYIKFTDSKSAGFLSRIRGYFQDEIDLQVHVHCNCPDFKYRWHWVLARNNCSHKPTGIGFDAIDSPPSITNPSNKISMCKHLVVAKDYLLLSASEHYKEVRVLNKNSSLKPGKIDAPDTRKVDPNSEVETND